MFEELQGEVPADRVNSLHNAEVGDGLQGQLHEVLVHQQDDALVLWRWRIFVTSLVVLLVSLRDVGVAAQRCVARSGGWEERWGYEGIERRGVGRWRREGRSMSQ